MSCIDQLRRIRETASGHCADILDRAIAALEDEQRAGGMRAPEATPRPAERRTRPENSISDDERQWTE